MVCTRCRWRICWVCMRSAEDHGKCTYYLCPAFIFNDGHGSCESLWIAVVWMFLGFCVLAWSFFEVALEVVEKSSHFGVDLLPIYAKLLCGPCILAYLFLVASLLAILLFIVAAILAGLQPIITILALLYILRMTIYKCSA